MQMNCLPIVHGDETLYSVTARTRLLNAARNDRDACRSLFGPSLNMRVSEFPVNLVHFCSVTKESFGDTPRVLDELTVAGFFKRIGGAPWNVGSSKPSLATAGLGLSMLSNGSITRWQVCAECMKLDLATYAISYWRRSHQLPGAFLCMDHDLPLSSAVAPIKERHNRFIFPDDTDLKPAFDGIDFGVHGATLRRLSNLARAILDCIDWQIACEAPQRAVLCALRDQDILSPTGLMNYKRLATEFFNRYGFLHQHQDFSTPISSKGIDILGRSLLQPHSWRHPLHSLLLIDWLFGSLAAYHDHCEWHTVMHPDTTVNRMSAACQLQTNESIVHGRAKWRRACLEIMEASPSISRSTFARNSPKVFRWLSRYDYRWFDETLPKRSCRGKQAEIIFPA